MIYLINLTQKAKGHAIIKRLHRSLLIGRSSTNLQALWSFGAGP